MGEIVLSDKDEQLLMRHYDGERLSLFDHARLERIRSSAAGIEFLARLKQVTEKAASWDSVRTPKVDLWERIERRIEQEERAHFFSRRRQQTNESSFSYPRWMERLRWSFGGAVAAAGLTFLVSSPARHLAVVRSGQPTEQVALRNVQDMAERPEEDIFHRIGLPSAESLVQSLFGSEALGGESPSGSRIGRAVEVDWVRSDGRVKMLPDVDEGSPVIWVRPRSPIGAQASQRGFQRRLPSVTSIGNSALALNHAEGIAKDGTPPFQLYRDHYPVSIPVSNSR